MCSILAGIGGIGGFVYFLHIGSGFPSHAVSSEMNTIASSTTGGIGNIICALFGALPCARSKISSPCWVLTRRGGRTLPSRQ